MLIVLNGCSFLQENWDKLMAYGTRNLQAPSDESDIEQDYLAASREVSEAITLLRTQKTLHLELIERLIIQNMYGEAITHLEELLFQTPENARLHYLYAVSMATITKNISEFPFDPQMIRFHYKRAVELEPSNYFYAYAYAVYLIYEEEDYLTALDVCNTLIAIHSSDPRGYFLLARAEYNNGNLKAAIDAYERIRRLSAASDEQKEQALLNIDRIRGQR